MTRSLAMTKNAYTKYKKKSLDFFKKANFITQPPRANTQKTNFFNHTAQKQTTIKKIAQKIDSAICVYTKNVV